MELCIERLLHEELKQDRSLTKTDNDERCEHKTDISYVEQFGIVFIKTHDYTLEILKASISLFQMNSGT